MVQIKRRGILVRAVDIKPPAFPTEVDDFILGDLCDPDVCAKAVDRKFNEIFQFAVIWGV